MTNGLSHPYHLDESTFILGAAGVTSFLFCILLHIPRQWNRTVYHGDDTDVSRVAPVSPRLRPGGDTVAPGVFPVYHGI